MVARVPRDAVRSWGRRFVPAAFMMLLAAVVVGIVAMARDLPGGVSRARDGMHALSGTGRTFETIAACVGWVPRGALVVAVVAVVALPVSLLRRRRSARHRRRQSEHAGGQVAARPGAHA